MHFSIQKPARDQLEYRMNEKTVFVRTSSGEDEVRSKTAHLSKDIKRALLMVDGTATVAEIMRRASPSLRGMLGDMFNELARGGFIQDKAKAVRSPALVTPIKKPIDVEVDELDFTAAFHIPTQAMLDAEAARVARIEAEQAAERDRQQAERARREQEAHAVEQARLDAAKAVEQEKARLQAELAQLKAQAEAEARARADAEQRARQVAEAARLENERLAREAAARIKAEKAAAEAARHEAERLAREAAERIKAEKAAAEAARHEAERLAREAAERIKAEKAAAEAARHEAERLAKEAEERIRAEKAAAEAARHEAERLAREAEERIRAEKAAAEAARLEAERLAREAEARIRAEKAAAEASARAEDERHAKEAAEAKLRAEQHAAEVRAEAAAHASAVAEEKARLEAEVAKLKALAEAETQARIEATAQARREAEAARMQAEQQAAQAAERALADAQARIEAEQQAASLEAARVKAEHDAALARAEESAKARAEQQLAEFVAGEAVRAEAARLLQEQNQALEAKRALEAATPRDPSQWVARDQSDDRRKTAAAVQGCDSRGGNNGVPIVERRTTTAAVVFYDIVGYTKQPDSRQLELKQQFSELLGGSLDALEASERIILDTGDGAAVGFLQHPTDALESAIHFRKKLIEKGLFDVLRVRIGIHLGPVSLVKDMNGQTNMLGDGINSAQRIMSFAGQNQIYVSRAYFEFVSNLGNEYNDSFRYRGAQQDKHGREHQVYELLGAEEPVAAVPAAETVLADFNFDAFDAALSAPEEAASDESSQAADQLLLDSVGLIAEPAEPAAVEQPAEAPAEAATVSEPEAPAEAAGGGVDEPQYTEAEARELADAQAKKWEEAKLRAAESRRPPIFEQPPATEVEEPVAVVRPPRKPLPWGMIGAGLFVLLIAALFVVPALLPMQAYRGAIEQMLAEKLKQPVHIGQMEGRLLPTPHLLLGDIAIGDAKQVKVKQAQADFSFAALTSQVRRVTALELVGVEVGGFTQASDWLQQIAADHRYPVSRIVLSQGKLDADGISISDLEGMLDFDAAGKLSSGKLSALAHKFEVEMHATPEQKLQLAFSLRDSALPSLPNWVFEDLKAAGELKADELRITDLDGRILGGALNGEVRINWRSGWRVQGALMARVIPLQNINKLLSGDLDGSARFQAQSASVGKLADAAILNGTFSVGKGMISGVDVIETARLHSREPLPGGRTHFDALSGELFYANDVYQFRPIKLSDSVVKVAGALTVNRGQLSGNVIADLSVRGGSVGLQIGGTADSPSLSAPR